MKARGFVISRDTGKPAEGVAVVARMRSNGTASTLDVLASDEAGYVSFDIDERALSGPGAELWLEVPGVAGSSVMLANGGQGQLGDGPFVLEVDPSLPPAEAPRIRRPAIENPDVRDWELSPPSFVAPRELTIGAGTCAVPVPWGGPIHKVKLGLIVRRRPPAPSQAGAGAGPSKETTSKTTGMTDFSPAFVQDEPRTGAALLDPVAAEPEASSPAPVPCEIVEYEQSWYDLGHSLGSVVYSLPLAPCESVDLAVIEAGRGDLVTRTDTVVGGESLMHDLRRDRGIEESVETAVEESQGGWSVMGGIGAVAGPVVGNIGASASRSWGSRDLTGHSLQDIQDHTVQATSVVRSLNSTVVVQATQAERHELETRTVTNHNHCHALTVQYYEVLRRLRLETRHAATRNAVMIPFRYLTFAKTSPDGAPDPGDLRLVNRLRPLLEQELLRPELKPNFEAVRRLLFFSQAPPPPPPVTQQSAPASQDYEIRQLSLRLKRGPWGTGGKITNPTVTVKLLLTSGDFAIFSDGGGTRERWIFDEGLENDNSEDYLSWLSDHPVQLLNPVKRSELAALQIKWRQESGFRPDWSLRGVELKLRSPGGQVTVLKRETSATSADELEEEFRDFQGRSGMKEFAIPPLPPPPPPGDKQTETPSVPTKQQDEALAWELIAHLQDHAAHYTRALLAKRDPAWFSAALDRALGTATQERQSVDSVPVAVSGSHLVFALNGTANPPAITEPPRTDIVSLPTRGLLAEAQLGSCNACEKRDVTRFWKWDEAPCEEPPAISGVTPGFRGQTPELEPTQLPPSVVQVVQPPAAPDPTGLAAAIGAVTRADAFRDMTGRQELAGLLSGLASGAVSLEEARERAALLKDLAQAGGGDLPSLAPRQSPEERYDNYEVAKRIVAEAERLGMDEQRQHDLYENAVNGGGGVGPFSFVQRALAQAALGATPQEDAALIQEIGTRLVAEAKLGTAPERDIYEAAVRNGVRRMLEQLATSGVPDPVAGTRPVSPSLTKLIRQALNLPTGAPVGWPQVKAVLVEAFAAPEPTDIFETLRFLDNFPAELAPSLDWVDADESDPEIRSEAAALEAEILFGSSTLTPIFGIGKIRDVISKQMKDALRLSRRFFSSALSASTSPTGNLVHRVIQADYIATHPGNDVLVGKSVWRSAGKAFARLAQVPTLTKLHQWLTRPTASGGTGVSEPDILDLTSREIFEIKPLRGVFPGLAQVFFYLLQVNSGLFGSSVAENLLKALAANGTPGQSVPGVTEKPYLPGIDFKSPRWYLLPGGVWCFALLACPGVIGYQLVSTFDDKLVKESIASKKSYEPVLDAMAIMVVAAAVAAGSRRSGGRPVTPADVRSLPAPLAPGAASSNDLWALYVILGIAAFVVVMSVPAFYPLVGSFPAVLVPALVGAT
jgi:hypothetical protein